MPLRSCLLLACLLPLLASCESASDRALRKSPDYRAGYDEGCGSAGMQGANPRADSITRDEQAFAGNPAYQKGWNTGFNACRMGQMPSNQPTTGDSAFPPSFHPGQ
jgi:hypothetical protein